MSKLTAAFNKKPSRVSLVPLIDVVFILLLFFLLSTQLNLLYDINVEFPIEIHTKDPPEIYTLVLHDNVGNFSYSGNRFNADAVARVPTFFDTTSDSIIVIKSDDPVNVQGLIGFVDRLYQNGITNVSIFENGQ